MSRILIVTAVVAERDAAARSMVPAPSLIGPYHCLSATGVAGRIDLLAGGVGVACAAAATATALTAAGYDMVISAGIGGGLGSATYGDVVVADACGQPDLGAEGPDGFIPAEQIGLGLGLIALNTAVVTELAHRIGAVIGTVLTVSTVTGTQTTADALTNRYPQARAEAMEGAGVLAAASAHGVPFAELRAISNHVGPRDRSAWRLGGAFDALAAAIRAVTATALPEPVLRRLVPTMPGINS
jgi:futalosine hydrolase